MVESARRLDAPCIVLGWEPGAGSAYSGAKTMWYKVYMIELQLTTYFRENILYPINPQEVESEV